MVSDASERQPEEPGPIQALNPGGIIKIPEAGGRHHHYFFHQIAVPPDRSWTCLQMVQVHAEVQVRIIMQIPNFSSVTRRATGA